MQLLNHINFNNKCHAAEEFLEVTYINWGSRVVIPPPGRALVLEELHDSYLRDGIIK